MRAMETNDDYQSSNGNKVKLWNYQKFPCSWNSQNVPLKSFKSRRQEDKFTIYDFYVPTCVVYYNILGWYSNWDFHSIV